MLKIEITYSFKYTACVVGSNRYPTQWSSYIPHRYKSRTELLEVTRPIDEQDRSIVNVISDRS